VGLELVKMGRDEEILWLEKAATENERKDDGSLKRDNVGCGSRFNACRQAPPNRGMHGQ
jgi:hypothetical protein